MASGRLKRAVLKLAIGTAAGQAIVVVAAPILTRLYSPSEFGVYGIFLAIIGIVGVASTLRYEFAFPIVEDEKSVSALAVLSATFVLLVSAATFLVAVLLWKHLEIAFSISAFRGYLWTLPLGVASVGLLSIMSLWATREERFKTLAWSRVSQGVGVVAVQLGSAALGATNIGLLIGDVAGRVISSTHIARHFYRQQLRYIAQIRLQDIRSLILRFRKFPALSAPAALFNNLGLRLPVLLLGSLYGIEAAGLFMLSQRIVGTPVTLLSQSISKVYASELGRRLRGDRSTLKPLFLKTTARLASYSFIPAIVLAFIAPAGFAIAFGPSWYSAGEYARVMMLMLACRLVDGSVSLTLTMLERQGIQFAWDVGRTVVTLVGFVSAAKFGADDVLAVAVYCGVMSAMYALHWALSYVQISKA